MFLFIKIIKNQKIIIKKQLFLHNLKKRKIITIAVKMPIYARFIFL